MNKKINLYIEYWKCPDSIRDQEILEAIQKNIDSGLFNYIFIFFESNNKPTLKETNNIKYIETKRLKLSEFLSYINNNTIDNDINILACSDIIFNETILESKHIKHDEFFAITRYELDGQLHNPSSLYGTSQDCWIFLGRFKGNLEDYNFYFFGMPGADGKFAFNTIKYYIVKNPCKTIKNIHYHGTNIRIGDSNQNVAHEKVSTPHLFVKKCFLADEFKYDDYLVWDETFGHCLFDEKNKKFPCLPN